MKTWQKRISLLLLGIITILVIWDMSAAPSSEECSICGHLKCHAPCILNLATGEIGELELYQPHFQKVGEIAEEQPGGTFSFIHLAGLQGIKITDPWYIEMDIPMAGEKKNNSFFCEKCRKLLREYEKGYVLIDMYDFQNPAVYPFEDGGNYEIRCYQITTSAKWSSEAYLLRVDGSFHGK